MLKKGLFVIRQQDMPDTTVWNTASDPVHYSEEGFIQSRLNRGNLHALKININRIFQRYREQHAANVAEQEQKKAAYQQRIQQLVAENNQIDEQIATIKTIKKEALHAQIATCRNAIKEIRNNPGIFVNGTFSTFTFRMSAFLLAGLSVYLFVFYTSSAYAAFYRNFNWAEIKTAQLIFDPKAIPNAYHEGFMEVMLLLSMPFVFMSVGFLLHKMLEKRTPFSIFRLVLFLLLTISFNAIIGFQIGAKIKMAAGIAGYSDFNTYTLADACNDPIFWQVIFAGFIGYFLWGLVLDFFTDGLAKRNRLKTALLQEKNTIADIEIQLQAYDCETDVLADGRNLNKEQIRKLESFNDIVIINTNEFEHHLYEYLSGWIEWMQYKRMPESEINQAHAIAEEFTLNMKRRFEAITD